MQGSILVSTFIDPPLLMTRITDGRDGLRAL